MLLKRKPDFAVYIEHNSGYKQCLYKRSRMYLYMF